MTRYVTVKMLCAHTGKAYGTVVGALKRSRTPFEKIHGTKGIRVSERDANKFLALQWPETGPLPPHPSTHPDA